MDAPMNGLVEHGCATIGQKIWIPVGVERFTSKWIVSAQCRFCGKNQFEATIEKAHLPTKGSYVTV